MRILKKTLIAAALFLLITAVVSVVLIEPLFRSEYSVYCDAKLREKLAGSLDYLFIGASNGYTAFVPPVADEEMHVNSYNLSGGLMTWYGRRTLLEKEIARNPVKTVVLEISCNSFQRLYHNAEGDAFLIFRLDSPAERLRYTFFCASVADWDYIYANVLGDGIGYWMARAQNAILHKDYAMRNVDYALKGFHARTDPMSSKEKLSQSDVTQIDTEFKRKNLDELYKIVDLCKSRDIELLFVVVPISDREIFKYDNWNELQQKWTALSEETGCPLVDFNLLRDRYTLFHDAESFSDTIHMTETGARLFTKVYAETMTSRERGEDISDRFYPDYAAMRADSPLLTD